MSVLQDLIPEVIPSQKCHMHTDSQWLQRYEYWKCNMREQAWTCSQASQQTVKSGCAADMSLHH
jgi:hypothetical protein